MIANEESKELHTNWLDETESKGEPVKNERTVQKRKTSGTWIPVITVLGIAGIMIAFSSTQGTTSSSTASNQTTQTTPSSSIQPQNGTLAEQQECNTDGRTFVQNWLRTNFPAGGGWTLQNDPTYHFSVKLNTCLAYVSAISVLPTYSINDPVVGMHEYYIYEIYSNTPILQSDTTRTCGLPQGTDSTNNNCTESLNASIYDSLHNLGSNDFISQEQVIMNQ